MVNSRKLIIILFSINFLLFTSLFSEEITIGEGSYKFIFDSSYIQLPQEHAQNVQDYHGIAIDSFNRVYVGYYSKNSNASTRTIARFIYQPQQNPPFSFDKFIGENNWVEGRLHGLNIIRTDKNEERLLLVYNNQKVILCDLDGKLDTYATWENQFKELRKASDGNKSPHSKDLFVYDGYASNKRYQLNSLNGELIGHSHGNKGKGNDQTSTAHGIGIDPLGRYVVADRGNKRLLWYDFDFKPIFSKSDPTQQLQLKTENLEVCNIAFGNENLAVLPCLNSSLAFLKKSTQHESGFVIDGKITMPKTLIEMGYDGIHDANFTQDMNYIVIAVWQRKKTIPPQLFALKRIH
jgi:hypothetical protein